MGFLINLSSFAALGTTEEEDIDRLFTIYLSTG